jgi:hypothetical protein
VKDCTPPNVVDTKILHFASAAEGFRELKRARRDEELVRLTVAEMTKPNMFGSSCAGLMLLCRSDRPVKILLWLAHPKPTDGDYSRVDTPNGLIEFANGQLHEPVEPRECVVCMLRLVKLLLGELLPRFSKVSIQVHDFCCEWPRIIDKDIRAGPTMDGPQLVMSLMESTQIRQEFFEPKTINIDITTLKTHNLLTVAAAFQT